VHSVFLILYFVSEPTSASIIPRMRSLVISVTLTLGYLAIVLLDPTEGHGILLEPPGRSSLWRFDEFKHLNPTPNYDDNGLNCGGLQVQHEQNQGKCGECGDAYHLPRPRPQEAGSTYGKGIIAREYKAGDVMDIHVRLTANHLGHFEFRLCPNNDPSSPVEQLCLDRYFLEIAGAAPGSTKYFVERDVNEHKFQVKLPEGLTCSQCVLQWHYAAGNNWGVCLDGSGAIGCGAQETFRNCADISIV